MKQHLVGLTLVLCLVSAGCSQGSSPAPASGSTETASSSAEDSGAAATKSPAAELRAGLTYLLTEHTYLVGISTAALITNRGDLRDSAVAASLAALDSNSVALSTTLTTSGPSAAEFLTSWRQQVRLLVDYAIGKAERSASAQARARRDLESFGESFGLLMSRLVPELPAAPVTEELRPRIAALLATIDAQATGAPTQYQLLADAASLVPEAARNYSQAIAVRRRLGGSAVGPASDLRAELTSVLIAHVYQLSRAARALLAPAGKADAIGAAAANAALDVNAVALSKTLGAQYPELAAPLLVAWRTHNGYFLDLIRTDVGKDPAQGAKDVVDLASSRELVGQLINSAVSQLPARTIADELTPYVSSMSTAVMGLARKDPGVYKQLIAASNDMTGTAALLAAGIAANKRLS